MGQTHVQRYLQPLLAKIEAGEIDPSFVVTHRVPLADAPAAYKTFRDKQDSCIKVVLPHDRVHGVQLTGGGLGDVLADVRRLLAEERAQGRLVGAAGVEGAGEEGSRRAEQSVLALQLRGRQVAGCEARLGRGAPAIELDQAAPCGLVERAASVPEDRLDRQRQVAQHLELVEPRRAHEPDVAPSVDPQVQPVLDACDRRSELREHGALACGVVLVKTIVELGERVGGVEHRRRMIPVPGAGRTWSSRRRGRTSCRALNEDGKYFSAPATRTSSVALGSADDGTAYAAGSAEARRRCVDWFGRVDRGRSPTTA
jgi:hypothetical protein